MHFINFSRHNWEKIADTIYCVGGKKKEILDQSLLKVLHLSHVSGPLETFSRLYKKGEIYWSERSGISVCHTYL